MQYARGKIVNVFSLKIFKLLFEVCWRGIFKFHGKWLNLHLGLLLDTCNFWLASAHMHLCCLITCYVCLIICLLVVHQTLLRLSFWLVKLIYMYINWFCKLVIRCSYIIDLFSNCWIRLRVRLHGIQARIQKIFPGGVQPWRINVEVHKYEK